MLDPTNTQADNLNEVSEKIDELIELELKKIETLRQLKRTIDLARLVPAVLKRKASVRVIEDNSYFHKWRGSRLNVRLEGEEPVEFDLVKDKVPHSLWPKEMLAAYMRHASASNPRR
jgi:hypothetical protein